MLVGCSTAASLFPFVGTIVYMILRPPEYLEDVRERELEMQAAEARLHELDSGLCPHCDYRIERDFVRCPSCLRKLKERCVSCSRPLDQAWTICPYCETEVPGATLPSRRAAVARRRREWPSGDRSGRGDGRNRRLDGDRSGKPTEQTLGRQAAGEQDDDASGRARWRHPSRPPDARAGALQPPRRSPAVELPEDQRPWTER